MAQDHDPVALAQTYLAMNAAESGADVLIGALIGEIDRLRAALQSAPRPYPSEWDMIAYVDWFFKTRLSALEQERVR